MSFVKWKKKIFLCQNLMQFVTFSFLWRNKCCVSKLTATYLVLFLGSFPVWESKEYFYRLYFDSVSFFGWCSFKAGNYWKFLDLDLEAFCVCCSALPTRGERPGSSKWSNGGEPFTYYRFPHSLLQIFHNKLTPVTHTFTYTLTSTGTAPYTVVYIVFLFFF